MDPIALRDKFIVITNCQSTEHIGNVGLVRHQNMNGDFVVHVWSKPVGGREFTTIVPFSGMKVFNSCADAQAYSRRFKPLR